MLSKLRSSTLVTGSAVYLASNILNAGIPLILLPILTRHLTPAEYGEVTMFMILIAALGAVTGLNAVGAANRKLFDHDLDPSALSAFIGSCLQILVASSAVIFMVLWFSQDTLTPWLGLDPHWTLWAVAASSSGFVIQLRLGQWLVRQQARFYGALQVGQSLLNMLLSLVLVVGLSQGPEGRMTAVLVASAMFGFLALISLRRDGLIRLEWNLPYIKEALSFGIPLIPHTAGFFLLNAVDRVVIKSELGLAETGLYTVAAQFAGAMAILFDAVNKAYVPWLYERLKQNNLREKQRIVRMTYLYFASTLLMAAAMFAIGPTAVRIIAGPQFAEAGAVVGWVALGQAFSGMYLMVTNYVFFSKKTGLLSLATISAGLINVVLLVVLVNTLGLVGAGMAFALAMAIRFLLTWWVAQMRYPMPWFSA